MSAPAWRAVMDRSFARGAGLLALLAIADESPSVSGYVQCSITMEALAKKCRCSLRSMQTTIAKLIAQKRLHLLEEAKAHRPNTYEIRVPIYKRDTKKTSGLDTMKPSYLIREDPLGSDVRADLHCTDTPSAPAVPPNVIPITYPKPSRKRKA